MWKSPINRILKNGLVSGTQEYLYSHLSIVKNDDRWRKTLCSSRRADHKIFIVVSSVPKHEENLNSSFSFLQDFSDHSNDLLPGGLLEKDVLGKQLAGYNDQSSMSTQDVNTKDVNYFSMHALEKEGDLLKEEVDHLKANHDLLSRDFENLKSRLSTTELTLIEDLDKAFTPHEQKHLTRATCVRRCLSCVFFVILGIIFTFTFLKSLVDLTTDSSILVTETSQKMVHNLPIVDGNEGEAGGEDLLPIMFVCFSLTDVWKSFVYAKLFMEIEGGGAMSMVPTNVSVRIHTWDDIATQCAVVNYPFSGVRMSSYKFNKADFPITLVLVMDAEEKEEDRFVWVGMISPLYLKLHDLFGLSARELYLHLVTSVIKMKGTLFRVFNYGTVFWGARLLKTLEDISMDILDSILIGYFLQRTKLENVEYMTLSTSTADLGISNCSMPNPIHGSGIRMCRLNLKFLFQIDNQYFREVVEKKAKQDVAGPLYTAGGVVSFMMIFTGLVQACCGKILKWMYMRQVKSERKEDVSTSEMGESEGEHHEEVVKVLVSEEDKSDFKDDLRKGLLEDERKRDEGEDDEEEVVIDSVTVSVDSHIINET